MQQRGSLIVIAIALSIPGLTRAADKTLSLDDALALGRERAPAVLAARARIDEARGRSKTSAALLHANPEFEAGVGQRRTERGDFRDLEFGVSQSLELGGRRGARIAAGASDVSRTVAASEDVLRQTLRAVGIAFARGLQADARVRLARDAESLTADLLRTVERRHAQGDVAILDVNLARASLGRARADLHRAAADRAIVVGELRAILDIAPEDSLALTGTLQDRPHKDLPALQAQIASRPDLRVIEADIRGAEAEHRLGRGLAWPDLSLGSRFERDAGDDVVFGTASVGLPIFDRGQGVRSETSARVRRLRLEREAAGRTAGIEMRAIYSGLAEHLAAVHALERDALPLLDENETLARRSYETGQIGLPELLLVRRETFETRTEYLDRLLEAAIAGIELEAIAGVLR